MKQYKFELTLTVITILFMSVLAFSYQTETDANDSTRLARSDYTEREFNKSDIEASWMEQKDSLADEVIRDLTDQFIDRLAQPTDEDYRVQEFNTKSELIQSFSDIATEETVAPYIDFYYDELDDGLYIVPTSLPPWVDTEEAYTLDYESDEKVVMTQDVQSKMYGHYRIEITFGYEDGWRIVSIEHPPAEDEEMSLDTV
ncbi:hypothetical protein SAMN05421734_10979 [Pelagirhabdus alkalitolerans]|uniref:DUF3993 domain-containing protein n=1 Tax=Pelagirhabdus alkalitolerans TaxID=1612202 RepID=A0A1G6LVP0_9BACI|nr:hypothetical protein [Pelagirhabdus alkalitolerans]SDC47157.1 hypothetical protein SAMN05421734_10979 [Pelagirhabdus alkalitolerans]